MRECRAVTPLVVQVDTQVPRKTDGNLRWCETNVSDVFWGYNRNVAVEGPQQPVNFLKRSKRKKI